MAESMGLLTEIAETVFNGNFEQNEGKSKDIPVLETLVATGGEVDHSFAGKINSSKATLRDI